MVRAVEPPVSTGSVLPTKVLTLGIEAARRGRCKAVIRQSFPRGLLTLSTWMVNRIGTRLSSSSFASSTTVAPPQLCPRRMIRARCFSSSDTRPSRSVSSHCRICLLAVSLL